MLPASQIVNVLGKYLKRNIDSAESIRFSSNMCDVVFTIYYQIPAEFQIPEKGEEYNDVHEMKVDINITTYRNKVRINLIEISPQSRTIGFDVYEPELFTNMSYARDAIMKKVQRRVSRAYKDFDFLF